MEGKLCLTGTTGGLGSRVLHHVLRTLNVDPKSLIISLYNPSSLPEEYSSLDLDVRRGDYTDPSSLRKAFAGATKLLLVSYPTIAHEIRVSSHRNAIDAAVEVGVKHICYTSLAFGDESEAAVMQAHIDTTAYLHGVCGEGRGTDYTIIKEGIYCESFPLYLGYFDPVKQQTDRKVRVPSAEGGIAWVARDDLGEGTARLMLASGKQTEDEFKNKTVLLSGDQIFTLQQVADMITRTMGWDDKPVKVEGIGRGEYVQFQMEQKAGSKFNRGTQELMELWSTSYPAIQAGELAVVDPLLQKLLQRKLKSMEECVKLQLKDAKGTEESTDRYAR